MPLAPLRDPESSPVCPPSSRRRTGLRLLALLAGAAVLALAVFPRQTAERIVIGPPHPLAAAPELPPEQAEPAGNLFERFDAAPASQTRTDQVRPGQTLADILGSHLTPDKLAALDDPEDFSFSKLRSGQPYRLTLRDRELVSFEYDISPTEMLVIDETDGELAARVETRQCEVRPALIGATVRTSLSEAVAEAGGNASTAMALADIFGSDLDFSRDVQPGDTFAAVVERRYVEGRFAGLGRVLAARYVNADGALEGFGLLGDKGRLDYFDAQGRPLRKTFLRAPLSFLRVTSGFSASRLHPILKVRKAHFGVDYAAPTGTPVWTVGDGVVIERGRNHAAGNYITVRHGKTYVTRYNHFSRFAKGLAVGSRVVQGQVIGYVGSTGFATGPHLDFRMYENDRPVNALANPEMRAESLPAARLAELRQDILTLTAVLDGRKPPTDLAETRTTAPGNRRQ
ncbi:peptidoglycan DD-metalloendopeptidase family protein [Desulfovibrio aerotolerans]|uniref:Peptidoglycan DD-metalloendopeptidase family protein n=1 Tax=Solidesulfovibrio aerotolerans TaxID=295255 RepID=A0A7C9MNT8_9BACT|nr:peptidoglycan DD-metalloendopeptidase family protein [Solidesulfovibrio aerotolerans]MYL83032.1 peptidoglycan DD-metalloendopeptidase family protein [Solidesulfovibrio aerotolerans]